LTYNAHLLKDVERVLIEAEESGKCWIKPYGFAEFSVLSGLAPYIVEKPFIDDFLLGVCMSPMSAVQDLQPRGHMKTWKWQAACNFLLSEPHDWANGLAVRIVFAKEIGKLAQSSVAAIKGNFEKNAYILDRYGEAKPTAKARKRLRDQYGVEFDHAPWTKKELRTIWSLEEEAKRGVVNKEASLASQGMDEAATGIHMDVLIWDDASSAKNARSTVLKEKIIDLYQEAQSQIQPTAWQIDVGTIHANDDIHRHIQANYAENYEFISRGCFEGGPDLSRDDFEETKDEDGRVFWKCTNPDAKVYWTGYGQIDQDKARGFHLPEKEREAMALHYLRVKMGSMNPRKFANQYLNRAVADDEAMYRREWFKIFHDPPVGGEARAIFTDSATGRDSRSSYRVSAAVGLTPQDDAYVHDLGFGFWNPEQYIREILGMYDRYRADRIYMEAVAWQEAFKGLMKKVCEMDGRPMPRVIDIAGRSEVSKIERIEALEPRVRAGKLLFAPHLLEKVCDGKVVYEEAIMEFLRVQDLTSGRPIRVDIPDALSDIDVLDRDGMRIFRPPRRRTVERVRVDMPLTAVGAHAGYRDKRAEQRGQGSQKRLFGSKKGRGLFG
jgi:hypothetical protein